jgi:hypothetical protein
MGGAASGSAISLKIPAGHVEHRVDIQLTLVLPEIVEGDPLGMADEPGGLVVQGSGALFQGADPERDRYCAALGAESPAGRNCFVAG